VTGAYGTAHRERENLGAMPFGQRRERVKVHSSTPR
jgi:hypothetical protein